MAEMGTGRIRRLTALEPDSESYRRNLKANLSWARKKSNSSNAKIFCLCLYLSFCTKSRTSDAQVWVLSG